MSIKTAHDLGLDAVEALLQNRRLSRRILALAATRIQVSEGVLELMREGSPEKQLLSALFLFEAETENEVDLERLSTELDQTKLEQLLCTSALILFKDDVVGNRFTPATPWLEIRRGMNLDLPLVIKVENTPTTTVQTSVLDNDVIDVEVEDRFVIIATKDEVKTETGMALVVQRAQANLTLHQGISILATPDGKAKVEAFLQQKELDRFGQLFDLPTIADPDKFEELLLSLSFVMKDPGNREILITRATSTFADRPRRSRKVIAEIMKRYGLHASLMENIVFLCEADRPATLQIEAINMVVKGLTEKTDVIEAMMAAVTLIRVLEEESKTEVRQRAITCLSEKASLIATRLPRFLEQARAVPIMKTLLITDPEHFRQPVENFLLSFGALDSALIEAELLEDLDTITNPFVLMTFYLTLEVFTSNILAQREWAEKRWQLCLKVRKVHPQLLIESEERFKHELPGSFDTVSNILFSFSETDQVYFIELLDRNFGEALARNDAETVQRIAKFFLDQLIEEEIRGRVQLAILKTNTLISPRLSLRNQHSLWPVMETQFPILLQDEEYIKRFIASGRVLFAEVVDYMSRAAYEIQLQLTPICYQKVTYINPTARKFDEFRAGVVATLQRLSTVTAAFLTTTKPLFPFEIPYAGIRAIITSPLATADMLHELAISAIQASLARARMDQLMNAYRIVQDVPIFEERTLALFTRAFVRQISADPNLAFDGIRRSGLHSIMSEDLFFTTFVEMLKTAKKYPKNLLETDVALAASPRLNPTKMEDIITHLVETFLGVISDMNNIPDPPKPDGFCPAVPSVVTLAITGLTNLRQGERLSPGQLTQCKRQLARLVAQRPDKVLTRWVKDAPPPTEVPDHYKQALERTLIFF